MRRRVFEDFFPVSDTEALITTGPALQSLDRIERVAYTVDDHGKVRLGRPAPVAWGEYVRLGGIFGGELVYSEGHDGPHQPFVYEGARYCTDGWPHVQIYRDGELFLGHFGDMVQVSNPCFRPDGTMYFEARATAAPDRPDLWEVWSRAPDGSLHFVIRGANPAWFDGRLFYGTWNGREFDYRALPAPLAQ